MDKERTAYIFKKICNDNNIITNYLTDPCVYPKAQKNSIELSGARNANIRDGLSITKFLYWLKNEMIINKTDEIKAADYLCDLRKKIIYFILFPLILILQLMNMQLYRIIELHKNLTCLLEIIAFTLLTQVDNTLMEQQISQELLSWENLLKNNKIVLRVY